MVRREADQTRSRKTTAPDRERRTPPRVRVDGSRGNARVFWREWRARGRPCVGDGRGTRSRPARARRVARLTFGATECDEASQSLFLRRVRCALARRSDQDFKTQLPNAIQNLHHTTLVPLERLLAAPFVARASLPQTREARPFPTTASEHQRARLVSPRVQPRASPRRSSLERVASPAGSLADRVTSQTNARRWAEVAKRPRPPARPRCVSDLPRTPLRAALVAVSRSAPPHGSSRGRDDRRRRARPRRSRGDVTSRARVFFFQSRSNAFREPFADRRRRRSAKRFETPHLPHTTVS